MTRIVILDGFTENPGDLSWDALASLGDLVVYDRTPVNLVAERIAGADVVYTNKTPISRAVIENSPALKYIAVLATGFNIVDVQAAKERGIPVSNIPTYGTSAVSQYVFALLLEICHHVGHHDQSVKAGHWTSNQDWSYWDFPLMELAGKTIGIWGFGRIGKATARIAEGFGMQVLAFDQHADPAYSGGAEQVSLDELLKRSDIISMHVPLFPDTDGVLNSKTIAKMKDGVIIINTSRGGLTNEAEMRAALDSGKVAWYAADTVREEPIRPDNPMLGAFNCLLTPHIAWAPKESRQRLMDQAVANLKSYLDGAPINIVNR